MLERMPPLARVRRLKGYTVRSLAAAVGRSVSAIADIESGATRLPRPSTVARIAAILDVDPSTITEFGNGDSSSSAADHTD